MVQLDKKKYRVVRLFGYQKPMMIGEEILLTDFEAGRYGQMIELVEPSVSEKKSEVNEMDEKPNKKLTSNRGRRKSK
jgi:hypothetical protein